jgi:gamma-glutamyltranspeptidase
VPEFSSTVQAGFQALANSRLVLGIMVAASVAGSCLVASGADYVGGAQVASVNSAEQSTALEILGKGGGSGSFLYKGGGNAVDAVVAAGLTACVVNSGNCSLGGYGGHMIIYKAGLDGDPPLLTCIDFNGAAGSLATSNMFAADLDPVTGTWTNAARPANQYGWKAAGVPGTFAGLYMAQTNFGRKLSGTNFFPFAEILKPALARIANGQATGNAYYTLSSLSNLVMDLYTNSPGYLDQNGQPNPQSVNNPYTVFYSGDIASDIVAAMQANAGLVTYADLTNYRPRVVQPYLRHFSPPNGTPAWVCAAPLGASGVSVLQELAMAEALGWTNGPAATWDSLHYWHSRAEIARLMCKDHYQWLGDPWAGILPPDFLGNGSTNFGDQMVAHATNGYPFSCPADPSELRLTNSLATSITQAVNNETNVPILVHWNDIRYGTCNISTCDKWGNCVAMTFSMGGGFGAQVGVTNRGLVFGQAMALFDPRPGWPNSIAPGKRQVDNMCPMIILPDHPGPSGGGLVGGRPPLAIGGVGGSTIENNMSMAVMKYLMDPPSSAVSDPVNWLYNFEGSTAIYMRPSYPAGVQSYLQTVHLAAPGAPPSAGELSYVQAYVAPVILSQPASTNVPSGGTASFAVNASGLPLFYQWFRDGVALTNGGTISGAQTPQLTLSEITAGGSFFVTVSNGAASLISDAAGLSVNGAPAITLQPVSRTNFIGTVASFSASAIGSTPLSYQWQQNGAHLVDSVYVSGAKTRRLSLGPVAPTNAGLYTVIVSNAVGTASSMAANLAVMSPSNVLTMLWGTGPADGNPWMNLSGSPAIPNQRAIAYNVLSNHLYVISRSSPTTSNYVVHVLNATNGALVYTLKTNGVQSNVGKGGIGLVGVGVADDGAIYACNVAPDSAGSAGTDPASMFRLYRWANGDSGTSPTLIFIGDPSGSSSPLRWGDNLAVRGAGTNTQVLVDMTYFGNTLGSTGYAAVLSPSNVYLTNFVSRWFVTTNLATGVGRSLEFDGTNNAIWQKEAGSALFKTVFNPAVSLGGNRIAATNLLAASAFPSALMGIGMDSARGLAAGVFSNSTTVADTLNFYAITNLNFPLLVSQVNFPTTPRTANNNRITQTFFKNDLVFTIDANNGIMVFQYQNLTFSPQPIQVSNLASSIGGNFQFGYSNSDSAVYSVFASTNLVNWNYIGTPTQAFPGWFQFFDATAAGRQRQFYQLRRP